MNKQLVVPESVQSKLLEIVRDVTKNLGEEKYGDNIDNILPDVFCRILEKINNFYSDKFGR